MTRKVSIITLTYNQLDRATKLYIDSLYKNTPQELFELIIVDNASTDGTIEYLKKLEKKYSNVKVIYNKENQGYSKGNNQGLEIAECEFVGFLNNDILLSENWLQDVLTVFAKEEKAALVGPVEINAIFTTAKKQNFIKYFKKNYPKTHGVDYVNDFDISFACAIGRKSLIDEIGGFDENYTPAFFEDLDMKYSLIQNGYNVISANRVCFYHFNSLTSKGHNPKFDENKRYFYEKYQYSEYIHKLLAEIGFLKIENKYYKENLLYKAKYKVKIRFEKIFRGLIKKRQKNDI